jgi:hypothetical protein
MNEWIVSLFESYPVLGTVLSGVLAAHGLAIFIVNLTPTPRDDKWVRRVYKVIEQIAGIVSEKSKEK